MADGGSTVGVQWHVENDGVALPFTRGCSMYKTDADGLLVSGFDVPEPAPLKPGSAGLALLSLASKLIKEPIRGVPLVAWGLYCTIVFFSNGILPGPDGAQCSTTQPLNEMNLKCLWRLHSHIALTIQERRTTLSSR